MHQFISLQTVGRRARKSAEGPRATVAGLLDEAARKPAACRHVAQPQPPTIVGPPLDSVKERALELARTAIDSLGRRLRVDGAVLLAGVVSYPVSADELRRSPSDRQIYGQWILETMNFIRSSFGEAITFVQHVDEAYPHLHFFALPEIDQNRRLSWDIHPGLRAKRLAAQAGASKSAQDQAYRDAMRLFQDHFWRAVSRQFGHNRTGPRRARYSRRAYMEIRDLQAKLAELEAQKLELEAKLATENSVKHFGS